MRWLFVFLFLLCTNTIFAQKEEIYRLAFSDPSNFRITTLLGNKKPGRILVIDTTQSWFAKRFWLEELEGATPAKLQQLQGDEHHPYNHTYLFRDTALARLIDETERKDLARQAASTASVKISLRGKTYQTIPSVKNIRGFYFITTEPLFSPNGEFAFIDLLVFYKDKVKQDENESYYGTACIVYQKDGKSGRWRKIKVRDYLIL